MPSNKKLLQAAAGNAGESVYVEDVFSTYLYAGNSTAGRAIVNGIDLSGEGGLVWIKTRDYGYSNNLFDTARGSNKYLISNSYNAEGTDSNRVSSFNSNGFTLGTNDGVNGSSHDYVGWSFRKAEKFFDVQTWTGNGVTGRTVSHNLGSVPGSIIIKRTDAGRSWIVYHQSTGNGYITKLDQTAAKESSALFNSTTPTDALFTLNNDLDVNASGGTYVAYLFASDAGGFGDDEDENIIKCGSYTGTSSLNSISCGFEPQFVLVKCSSHSSTRWSMFDAMRGVTTGSSATTGDDKRLAANASDAESAFPMINFTATGFDVQNQYADVNENGRTYIYIAIRRPMKTPESGTEVFSPSTYAGNDPTPTVITTGFPVDLALTAYRDLANAGAFGFTPRLTEAYLYSATNAVEVATGLAFDSNTSFATDANHWNQSPSNLIGYGFKRATGFMDAVGYIGDGSGAKSFSHNLGVAPELMILKGRSLVDSWFVFANPLGASARLKLETTSASGSSVLWDNTLPTATQFRVGSGINQSTETYINYLFATLAGVSKVGSYTGTGSNVDVDCGFSAGARFILIKRTDSTGDWYVWDSARGIVAGNDPYLLLNSSAAEVTNTDYIDPLSSGFTVTSSAPNSLNKSGGSYIFLAIA